MYTERPKLEEWKLSIKKGDYLVGYSFIPSPKISLAEVLYADNILTLTIRLFEKREPITELIVPRSWACAKITKDAFNELRARGFPIAALRENMVVLPDYNTYLESLGIPEEKLCERKPEN